LEIITRTCVIGLGELIQASYTAEAFQGLEIFIEYFYEVDVLAQFRFLSVQVLAKNIKMLPVTANPVEVSAKEKIDNTVVSVHNIVGITVARGNLLAQNQKKRQSRSERKIPFAPWILCRKGKSNALTDKSKECRNKIFVAQLTNSK
jgi:hypothetical protein